MQIVKMLLVHTQPLTWVGAAIAAGASLIGGAKAASSQTGGSKQAREFEHGWRLHQDWRNTRKYRDAVIDAKAAGLHPLFALGSGGGGSSPSYSSVSYPQTGSAMGEGIAEAGRQIGRGFEKKQRNALLGAQEKRNRDLHAMTMRKMALEIERDEMANMAARSQIKVGEQVANYKRPPLMEISPEMTEREILYGPFGGAYRMPEGVTPADAWEQRGGEPMDWVMGPGLMMRMYRDRRARLARMRNQIQAVKRFKAKRRNVKRAKQSRWNKFKSWFQ